MPETDERIRELEERIELLKDQRRDLKRENMQVKRQNRKLLEIMGRTLPGGKTPILLASLQPMLKAIEQTGLPFEPIEEILKDLGDEIVEVLELETSSPVRRVK